jgi:CPA2 family monovalent cation:H+ antiporter-2
MHHDTPLITTIVLGLVLAYIFGMVANRLKLPPLVGYLVAGVVVGPHTPGYVADQALGAELAELGVILLMFGVGLHFSLKDLMSVRALAIPGAVVQIGVATLMGLGLGLLLGWGLGAGLLFGLALSVASTVVLLKALQDRRLIDSERGRIAVGWLIVEDLAMVLALVLIPAIASMSGTDTGIHDPFVSFVERIVGGSVGIWGVLALTIIKVAAFVGFMLVVGRRVIPWALHATAHTGSRELFRLAVLAIALGVALGSAVLFGVSLALGAFFAGMILSESELSHRAANETLPLRDAFAVLFFVSVGMLFDPTIIVTDPLPVIATVFIIVIGKSLAAFGIVLLFRRPVGTALTISASLAQIGEFSFILASMGVALAILPQQGQDLILAGALISIVLNPLVFWTVDKLRAPAEARFGQRRPIRDEPRVEPGDFTVVADGPATTDIPTQPGRQADNVQTEEDAGQPTSQTGHAILVGYGQVGRIVADGLKADGAGVVVIEDSEHDVAAARSAGFEVVFGNAASEDVLKLANIGGAKTLLVAISNGFEAGSVCESGRKLNAGIAIIARAYSEEEESFLRNLGAGTVIRGEREIGRGILAFLREQHPELLDTTSGVDLPEARIVVIDEPPAAAAALAAAGTAIIITAENAEEADPAEITPPAALDEDALANPGQVDAPAESAVVADEPVEVHVAPVVEAIESVPDAPPADLPEDEAANEEAIESPASDEAAEEREPPGVSQPVDTVEPVEPYVDDPIDALPSDVEPAPDPAEEISSDEDDAEDVPPVLPEPKP